MDLCGQKALTYYTCKTTLIDIAQYLMFLQQKPISKPNFHYYQETIVEKFTKFVQKSIILSKLHN